MSYKPQTNGVERLHPIGTTRYTFSISRVLWQVDRFYLRWATVSRIARHSNTPHSGRHHNSPMPSLYPATWGAAKRVSGVPRQQNIPRRYNTCHLMADCRIPIRMLQLQADGSCKRGIVPKPASLCNATPRHPPWGNGGCSSYNNTETHFIHLTPRKSSPAPRKPSGLNISQC